MCGIAGLIGDGSREELTGMLDRLGHRGPDDRGLQAEPGVLIGMQRLSVIDVAGGHQPISNETGTISVVLNGELYNYRELRDELLSKGHRFATQSDTEVLVHLYEQEGEQGIARLRGMFAFALWDRTAGTVLLARDRLGIKPLYLAERPGGVAFASELPALLSVLPPRSPDPAAIAAYLHLLYIPHPMTLWPGVREVAAGETVRIAHGRLTSHRYFELSTAWRQVRATDPLPVAALAERFVEALKDSVRAHLISEVPLGLFLSGGLDSGALLAMMRAVTPGRIRTFSIGYAAPPDAAFNELDAARVLADRFGSEHTEERLRPDIVSMLPRIVAAMGEPFADASAIPTYLVAGVARQSVTVALSGIGGDELFGGYPRYLGIQAAKRYASLPRWMRRSASSLIAPCLPERGGHRDSLARLKRFLQDGHRPLAQQYARWVTFLPPDWGPDAFMPALREAAGARHMPERYAARFDHWPSMEPADRAMGLDLQTYLPDDLLRMGDRLSMAHSLELRVPFCDPALLQVAFGLRTDARFAGWRLKGFMRNALRGLLPEAIRTRPKTGFQVPLARWLREDLREMVQDLLGEESIRRRGYVKPAYAQWLVQEHAGGRRNCSDQLYALLVLELWHRAQPTSGLQPAACGGAQYGRA